MIANVVNKTNVAVAINRATSFAYEARQRPVLYFDGNLYLETPVLNLEAGDIVRFQWQGEMPAWRAWISFAGRRYEIRHNDTYSAIETRPAYGASLNGVDIESNVTSLPDPNKTHTFELVVSSAVVTRIIVGSMDREPVTSCGSGYFFNFEVVGKHKYPMDEGSGDVANDLIGSAHAQIRNAQPASWEMKKV